MIRKIFISLILVFGLWFAVEAQTDNRSRETKIADVVMLLPVDNSVRFNNLMNELYSLGKVINDLAPRLAEPGGKDAQIRYAIAGLATFASQKAEYKAVIAKDLCNVIPSAKSDEIRDFLLIQLQYVAGDESVETVAKYLNNDRLCDAAARVLIRINNAKAANALFEALKTANAAQQITLVQATGDVASIEDVSGKTPPVPPSDAKLRKVVLAALAAVALPESEKVLNEAVAQVNYLYEPTGALEAYLKYLRNRLAAKDVKQVLAASKKLLTVLSENKQLAAKTAALDLYVSAAKGNAENKAVAEIVTALKSDNKQYRRAALDFSLKLQQTPKMYETLLNILKKEKNPEIKADVIYGLGIRGEQDLLNTNANSTQNPITVISTYLSDASPVVKQAAIEAVGKLVNCIPSKSKDYSLVAQPKSQIIAAMNTDNAAVVETGKITLKSLKCSKIVGEMADALPQTSVLAKTAFIEILASRKAVDKFDVVYSQATATESPELRLAAYRAFKDLAQEQNAPLIAKLLNTANNTAEIEALQDALFASIASLSQDEQSKRVTGFLKTGRNPSVYYNVFAKIGGANALKLTLLGMDGSHSDRAFEALTNWSDAAAIPALVDIAKNNPKYSEKALDSYILKVNKSKNTPEQKLILLRSALETAKTDKQKQQVIQQIAETKTFLGLITAGNYLDDKNAEVRQAAVQAVRKIALSNTGFYGAKVSELLNKAIAANTDPEAEYQKQEIQKHLASLPQEEGFVSLFNGKDLSGWKGLVENPVKRSKMTAKQLAEKQKAADEIMVRDWRVENGLLVFEGKGYDNLCSDKQYADFELYVDWRITPEGDAGIYLRGTPQVQIWDTSLRKVGAQVGSGGLYNNKKNESKPLVVADNAVNEWNSFYIKMIGEKVLVYLNGQLVTNNVTLENYWDRALSIFPKEQIELQAHGTRVEYRDIYIREIPRPKPYEVPAGEKAEGFVPLFNGMDMSGWVGNLIDYVPDKGIIKCVPSRRGGHGNLFTEKEYSDFVLRFEFKLTPAANNGLGIRTPLEGDPAYVGMELQILDNEAEVYKNLHQYQYHGSVYGVIAAKRGYLKPTGEWNVQEVVAQGNKIKVTLNGTVILEGDIAEASKNFTAPIDGNKHPGLSNKSGHIGFLGHGSEVEFRNIRIKEL